MNEFNYNYVINRWKNDKFCYLKLIKGISKLSLRKRQTN